MPRLLVLTGTHIEYYRNEAHLYQKKSFTEPIVRVPYKHVKIAKKFAVTETKVMRKMNKSRFSELEDPANLYKCMIEVQLKEGKSVQQLRQGDAYTGLSSPKNIVGRVSL